MGRGSKTEDAPSFDLLPTTNPCLLSQTHCLTPCRLYATFPPDVPTTTVHLNGNRIQVLLDNGSTIIINTFV
ncbi:uncharacterized [Tachysurus ichikawai]